MEEEIVSEAKVMNRDGSPADQSQQELSELLDRLFKAITRRIPDESLATRSNLAIVTYEEFYMWANKMTREEYETADVLLESDL